MSLHCDAVGRRLRPFTVSVSLICAVETIRGNIQNSILSQSILLSGVNLAPTTPLNLFLTNIKKYAKTVLFPTVKKRTGLKFAVVEVDRLVFE